MRLTSIKSWTFVLFLFIAFSSAVTAQQKMDRIERERMVSILKNIKNTIRKNYYDPNFHGMDIETRFNTAEEKLKTVDSLGQALSVIAQAVIDLNDSHTRFNPPARNSIVDYGWKMKMFGNRCFVTNVREKSDAEGKGIKVGDEILSLNGFRPTRSEMWKMIYYYQQLNPQTKMNLSISNPQGEVRQLEIASKITTLKAVVNLTDSIDFNEAVREGDKVYSSYKHYFKDLGSVVVWKMPDFAFDPGDVEGMMGHTERKQALILDLRGNRGGYVVTLERLVGYIFDHDIKIADRKSRKEMDPQSAKTQQGKVFNGKLIVLVDSTSASAAEIFSRLIQIEKRGIVLGDTSAGAVMQSMYYPMDAGSGTYIPYGMSITNADVIMSDGKSLEHVGVTPDEIVIPNGEDLAMRRDPVMARALDMLGVKMSSDDAGKIFPVEKDLDLKTNFRIHLEF